MENQNFPEGIRAWKEYLEGLTADKIVWNYHWFPSKEVIYMSTFRPFIVLMGLRGVQPYVPLRVMRQFGRRQHIPPVEDMKEFMYEFLPDIPLRKTEILKIWGGCVLSGFDHMVEDRDKGEVDYWYLPWFHDQPPPKAMPERSAREPVDREAEIEVRIKQARREEEENYQSTLHVLNNDLERAREELVHHEAKFEARIRLVRKEIERKNHVAMHALQEDLDIIAGAMEQQSSDFEKEKASLISTQSKLQAQLKASMEREREIARRFTTFQKEVEAKENQWMTERQALHYQIDDLHEREEDLKHTIRTTQHCVRNCHKSMIEARGEVLQLSETLINVYAKYLHQGDENLGRQARALAPHLPKALSRIYSSLRED